MGFRQTYSASVIKDSRGGGDRSDASGIYRVSVASAAVNEANTKARSPAAQAAVRAVASTSESSVPAAPGFAQIDFEHAEKNNLRGSRSLEWLQYFCTRAEFVNRAKALIAWSATYHVTLIYGVITIDTSKDRLADPADEVLATFEDFFIRSIRVPRNYILPPKSRCQRRKSDKPLFYGVRGNFDLARRIPGGRGEPHMIEFILYDCKRKAAVERANVFEDVGGSLGLHIRVDVQVYRGQGFKE